jgi:hypothetical protein
MEPIIVSGLIGATGTIVGALIGRLGIVDRLLTAGRIPRLTKTRWESTWQENDGSTQKEIFNFTRQRGTRVSGFITKETEPNKEWKLAGDFNGRFLRLNWQPSRHAGDKLFLDYGSYFFEMKGNGSFIGYAVGFDYGTSQIEVYVHHLNPIR